VISWSESWMRGKIPKLARFRGISTHCFEGELEPKFERNGKKRWLHPKPNYIFTNKILDFEDLWGLKAKAFAFASALGPQAPLFHHEDFNKRRYRDSSLVSSPYGREPYLEKSFFPPTHLVIKYGHHLPLHTSQSINILSYTWWICFSNAVFYFFIFLLFYCFEYTNW